MNGDRSEVIAAEGSTVEPMEGLFVVAEGADETVTFTKNTRETRHEERIVINLSRPSTGSGTGVIDRAIVRFGAGKSLPKFMLDPSHTKLYIPQDGEDYAIVNADETGVMPVHFKAESNGSYTITVKPENVELEYLHLIDHKTGADVDLLPPLRGGQGESTSASYSFEAKTTDYASRFKLVFSTNGPSTSSGTDQPFAFCANGDWIINGEGTLQIFDMLGRQIYTREAIPHSAFRIPHSAFPTPGVYVLRLIDGDSVRVQKIIVE